MEEVCVLVAEVALGTVLLVVLDLFAVAMELIELVVLVLDETVTMLVVIPIWCSAEMAAGAEGLRVSDSKSLPE